LQSSDHSERWELQSVDTYMREKAEEEEKAFQSASSSSAGPADEKSQHSIAISHIAQYFEPFHTRTLDLLRKGDNVIVDHCFGNDEIFKNALYHFKDEEVFFVKIYTDYPTAMQRLQKRNANGSCPD